MNNSSGFILWLLGPTSSGKTTVASALTERLCMNNIRVIHYDGDEVRDFFDGILGFTSKDRLRVVKTLVHLSNKTLAAGVNVVVSALTANDDARSFVGSNCRNLITVYIECSIDVCSSRDPKKLYLKAKNGEINTLIGFNRTYTAPTSIDLIINTEQKSVGECADILFDYLSNTIDYLR